MNSTKLSFYLIEFFTLIKILGEEKIGTRKIISKAHKNIVNKFSYNQSIS